jgi:glucose-6-phosphate dehydrogenase assembly protein OpcA
VNAPLDPAKDPLGALAQRRVTDTYAAEQPVRELSARAEAYTPGDTDLSWTRITPWRSMLAAALDQVTCEVKAVEVEGEEFNPSCELLAMWLADRLDVPVKRSLSGGPGLTAVRMDTSCGPIVLDRADGTLATLSIQGQPARAVALKRRETAELIAEELRRLDPDDTYASALRYGVERLNPVPERQPAAEAVAEPEPVEEAAKAPAKKAAAKTAKKAPARKATAK